MAETRTQRTGTRSAADVTSLLIELGRSLKARRFYPGDHPARKATLDRSFRAWQAELARSGPLELEVRQGAFRVAGAPEPLGRGPLDELAREFVHHAVRRVRFEPDLGLEGFDALVSVLAMDPDEVQEGGGVERVLYARARDGVRLNAVDYAALSEREARTDGSAAEDAEGPPTAASVDGEPAPRAGGEAETAAPPAQTTDVDPLAQLGGLLSGEGDESNDGALRPETEPDRGAELVGLLRSLDESRDDDAYARLLQRIAADVSSLPEDTAADEAYRAILVLSAHASESVRSERQRTLAEEGLFQLATGPRLEDVVRRACAHRPQPSVRATQILLQLGAHAVPRLFDALLAESDPERRGRLNAILIAMGEKATPELRSSLEAAAEDVPRARLAARLAGELQNPALAPYLRTVLKSGEVPLDLEKEAAKALQRIGGATATRILAEVVSSQRSELAAVAAHCLGSTGSPRALEVLVTALRRALREDDGALARETIRALGRLGREEAVPALAEILDKRSLLGRRKLRDLKLAAAAALGRLPGAEASACLGRVASGRGDAQVRRAARTALDRRSAS